MFLSTLPVLRAHRHLASHKIKKLIVRALFLFSIRLSFAIWLRQFYRRSVDLIWFFCCGCCCCCRCYLLSFTLFVNICSRISEFTYRLNVDNIVKNFIDIFFASNDSVFCVLIIISRLSDRQIDFLIFVFFCFLLPFQIYVT